MSAGKIPIFENEVPDYLICTICQEVFIQPKRATCGHTYCSHCIAEWTTKNKSCPICRCKIDPKYLNPDLIANYVINDLVVRCPNHQCEWKGSFEEYKDHKCIIRQTPSKGNVEDYMAPNIYKDEIEISKLIDSTENKDQLIIDMLESNRSAEFVEKLLNALEPLNKKSAGSAKKVLESPLKRKPEDYPMKKLPKRK